MNLNENKRNQPKRLCATLLASVLLSQALSAPAYATVSQVPGIFRPPPLPNVMFTLDDSGSMGSDAIPDLLDDTGLPTDGNSTAVNDEKYPGMWKTSTSYWSTTYYRSTNAIARYLRSAAGNPLYYDPTVTYTPWPTAADDSVTHANANPDAVFINISSPFSGSTRNIRTRVNSTGNAASADNEANNFWPATYYIYTGSTSMPAARPNNSLNLVGNFTKVEIKPSVANYRRAATRNDCTGAVGPTGCSYDQELQNFANWLQYYRSRSLMAKGGVAQAFSQQRDNLRVGFTRINTVATMVRPVARFRGTERTEFYNALYNSGCASCGTPLRRSMDDVGKYFQGNTLQGNPWYENPTSGRSTAGDECRKSFHIMSTDGFWKDANATAPANADNDNFGTTERTPPEPGGTQYAYSDSAAPGTLAAQFSVSPYRDNNTSNTNNLANVAAYYWKTDLQTGLANRIPPSTRDPAYWQHLTTFTVGLGVSGSGGARPADAALSSNDAVSGAFVVATNTPVTSPFYAYRGKEWLSDPALRDLLVAQRTPMRWPTTGSDTAETGDDLIHASMNARGRYFSATSPQALATGLASALAEATNQNSSYASLGLASTNETSSTNRLYQAIYNPSGWRGRLYAYGLYGATFSTTPGTEIWEASRAMPAPNDRNIFTWNPELAVPAGSLFNWAGLGPNQRLNLGPTASTVADRQATLEWLRGSAANESQNGGTLRDRVRDTPTAGVLGDIVAGSPLRGPNYGGDYSRLENTRATNAAARSTYSTFRRPEGTGPESPIRHMIRTIYFSANDGMVHAVNANDLPTDADYVAADRGKERFAFVPNAVFSVPRTYYNGAIQATPVKKLYEMSRADYGHLFTVNAPPQIADAYINPRVGNPTGWKSVLLGGTGAGARNVFALDVTNPTVGAAPEQFGPSKVLWEFSETQNPDMGHMPSWPNVGLMRDGTWVAIVGNGYDSTNGQAKLFLLDLATGVPIWEVPVGTAGGNGLSQPNFLLNSNREVIAIYAGDLRGNMWKFDVSSPSRSNWNVAFGGLPLFTTEANQPITVMPELEQFPNSEQAMVIFGTGKMFDIEDMSTDPAVNVNLRNNQAIYGIWDTGSRVTTAGVAQLQAQTIISVPPATRTTDNPVDYSTRRGWYIALEGGGERVNVNPLIPVKGRSGSVPVFVTTNMPDFDAPCTGGGRARIFALNPITGSPLPYSVFDANRDGTPNAADNRANVIAISAGLISTPRFLTPQTTGNGVLEVKPGSRGQTGALEGGVEFGGAVGRCVNTGRLIAGVSDTSATNEVVRLGQCTPRISWRQIR